MSDEILKIDKNGQWTLEKNWTPKHKQLANKWVEDGFRKDLNKLPKASGKLRTQMLGDIHRDAQEHRINPDTGHKEYKMFRAMPEGGHENDFHSKNKTSWTLDPKIAHRWAENNGQNYNPRWNEEDIRDNHEQYQIVEQWVPEHLIHSYLPSVMDQTHENLKEKEVIVEPHNIKPNNIWAGPTLETKLKRYWSTTRPKGIQDANN